MAADQHQYHKDEPLSSPLSIYLNRFGCERLVALTWRQSRVDRVQPSTPFFGEEFQDTPTRKASTVTTDMTDHLATTLIACFLPASLSVKRGQRCLQQFVCWVGKNRMKSYSFGFSSTASTRAEIKSLNFVRIICTHSE